MFDLTAERTLTLKQVRRLPYVKGRRGASISISALHRWASRGVAGVKLETIRAGGTLLTSEEAVRRFFERLTGGDTHPPGPDRDISSSEQKLDDAGIK